MLIDDRNFYDEPINDFIKQYDKVRKTATGLGDDYTTVYLLDYQYFKDHYQLIAVDLSKQEELYAYLRAIQQICRWLTIICSFRKIKKIMLEFYKGTAKVLWII